MDPPENRGRLERFGRVHLRSEYREILQFCHPLPENITILAPQTTKKLWKLPLIERAESVTEQSLLGACDAIVSKGGCPLTN